MEKLEALSTAIAYALPALSLSLGICSKPVNQLEKTKYRSHLWQSVVKHSNASSLGAARYKNLSFYSQEASGYDQFISPASLGVTVKSFQSNFCVMKTDSQE